MATMIMLAGPTGAGKSTFRRRHLPSLPCVSPDDFIVGRWTPRKCGAAWGYALQAAVELLSAGDSFVIDAMFVGRADRVQWLNLASGFGFGAVSIAFDTPWKQIRLNQKARGSRGLYGEVPLQVQRDTFRTFRAELRNIKLAPAANGWPLNTAVAKWADLVSYQAAVEMASL